MSRSLRHSSTEGGPSAGRQHPPTCHCPTCEQTGAGDFAVRAFMSDEPAALDRLSSQVARILPFLRSDGPSRPAAMLATPHQQELTMSDDQETYELRAILTVRRVDRQHAPWVPTIPVGEPEASAKASASDGWPRDPVEFGRAVREARESAHVTQAELAERAGVSLGSINNIERGRQRCRRTLRKWLVQALESLGGRRPSA